MELSSEYYPIEDDLYFYEESHVSSGGAIYYLSSEVKEYLPNILDKDGKTILDLNPKQRIGFI